MFKELLQHMQDNMLYRVKGVVWCVLPQPRMDALLQAQARFIEMFSTGSKAGTIWGNVVIICKGKARLMLSPDMAVFILSLVGKNCIR